MGGKDGLSQLLKGEVNRNDAFNLISVRTQGYAIGADGIMMVDGAFSEIAERINPARMPHLYRFLIPVLFMILEFWFKLSANGIAFTNGIDRKVITILWKSIRL